MGNAPWPQHAGIPEDAKPDRATGGKFMKKKSLREGDSKHEVPCYREIVNLPEHVHNAPGSQRAVHLARYALSSQNAGAVVVNTYCDGEVSRYLRHLKEMKNVDLYKEKLNVVWDSREDLTTEEVHIFCSSSDLWKGFSHPSGSEGMILQTERQSTGDDATDTISFVAWIKSPTSQYHLIACKATQEEHFQKDVFHEQMDLRAHVLEDEVRDDLRREIWAEKWFFTKMWYWSSKWDSFDKIHCIADHTKRCCCQRSFDEMTEVKMSQRESAFENCLDGYILHRASSGGASGLTVQTHGIPPLTDSRDLPRLTDSLC